MAKKAKNNKNLIIGICAGVLVIAVIIVCVVLAINNTKKLDDSYFVSDDTKYVLDVSTSVVDAEDEEYTPVKAYAVYTYSGDEITGMTTYFEFADEATAKAALGTFEEEMKEGGGESVKSISVNGKYIVAEMTEDNYADLTASDVKQEIELMEMFKNMNFNDTDDEDIVDVEDEDYYELDEEE